MKALSLWQPYASAVADGSKPVETRRWRTRYRGPLLVCAALRLWGLCRMAKTPGGAGVCPDCGMPYGCAVAIVSLVDVRPMTDADWRLACCDPYPDAFGWFFEGLQAIPPDLRFPVRGFPSLFDVEVPLAVLSAPGGKGAGSDLALWGAIDRLLATAAPEGVAT